MNLIQKNSQKLQSIYRNNGIYFGKKTALRIAIDSASSIVAAIIRSECPVQNKEEKALCFFFCTCQQKDTWMDTLTQIENVFISAGFRYMTTKITGIATQYFLKHTPESLEIAIELSEIIQRLKDDKLYNSNKTVDMSAYNKVIEELKNNA